MNKLSIIFLFCALFPGLTPAVSNLTLELESSKPFFEWIFTPINLNFTEAFPDINVKEEFSGFHIGQDGYPNINEIMADLNLDAKNFIDFDFALGNIFSIYNKILEQGKYNYIELIQKFEAMNPNLSNEEESAMNDAKSLITAITELANNNTDTEVKQLNAVLTKDNLSENIDEIKNIEGDDLSSDMDFKTKNGTLTVNIAGEEKNFNKITFSLSGQYSRSLVKPNFNLKIRGKQNLFGRSQFKLRSDLTEPTFLRSKLNSDIHKKMGLTSILANYATLYINDEYMGLFVLTDAYKLPWIEQVYGEKDSIHLYKCLGAQLSIDSFNYCENENDDIVDSTEISEEWSSFIETIINAKSAEDIEDIFEVDHFIKEMAIEYLLGAWDHLQLGHNFYLYKQPNGKWIYLTYDHDHSFGINLDRIYLGTIYVDLPERLERINLDYPNYSFSDWTQSRHLIDILILKDPTRFNQAIKEIVETVFNPATLFPHIDELKEFIRPYAQKDYTPNEEGNYPGRINTLGINPYTFEHWEANSEFTSVITLQYNAYGIKYWILAKYRNVCKTYDLECDPVYLDENFKYDVDENIEFKGYDLSSYDLSSLYEQVKELENFFEPTSTIAGPTPTAEPTTYETNSEYDVGYDVGYDAEVETEVDSEFDSETETETL
ncbi:coth-domain-containing protein [Neocallimastix californiae]|uniref:Coth-domain-containing protein n=1 Tax=Neocallimastix californiae TaxID=1754190 RepID=A0A1Y2F366_9FUNG|nr:coth-domain-containing protein [Neocallimastix californiae]|eukprot:ORY78283.1 coth-domain-containing protein [Neocallimastix californiae]